MKMERWEHFFESNMDYEEVSVPGNRIGIEQEHLEKLFEISCRHEAVGTAEEKGTGLGLILSREFLEKIIARYELRASLDGAVILYLPCPK
ncbi:MAG: hypothetical protein JRJ23_06435 [Deltaproteobacteria bacterium]|nr:hypothetical protein [Deltaproteobacteria bacterium]MBW1913667.1 hypothetical protein [Deltaproteobacteria bacterium]